MVKIYIDENFAHQLADGLNVFQSHANNKETPKFEVLSIKNVFGQGAKDEAWIPVLGDEGSIIITQDLHIQTTRHQRDLYHEYGLGVFFFKPPSKGGYTFWQMVQQIVNKWDDIKKKAHKEKRPFAFRCTCNRGFELID